MIIFSQVISFLISFHIEIETSKIIEFKNKSIKLNKMLYYLNPYYQTKTLGDNIISELISVIIVNYNASIQNVQS